MINSLRGMNDILGDKAYTYFLEIATNIAKRYGFEYIETPILEESALFKRSVGESSDIVGKEMYQFIDKGQNDVCMRPEGTAGVVRAFIQKKLDRAGGTHRFYYHGPMFRYERPQKGRLRSFHQFGIESFGEDSIYEDAMIISMVDEILKTLGITYILKLNSLGCSECMPKYKAKLVDFLMPLRDEICEDCKRRVETNPLRVLDCKNEKCQTLYKNAPLITQNLCKSCDDDFAKLKDMLNKNNLTFNVDPNLVRGLDYYSKTAFEFISSEIGSQSAIAGGGRYDRLVEFLDGKATPAIGFAMGIERLLELIKMPQYTRDGYYMGAMDDGVIETLFSLANKKRKTDKLYLEYKTKNLKNHLKAADKMEVKYCAIIGEDELKNGTIWVKNLEDKSEKIIKVEDF